MKKLIIGIMTLSTMSAFAGNLYYSNGPAKGKEVAKATGYIGSYDICFVSNGKAAKFSLYALLNNDIEKSSVFTTFDTKKDAIVYGYVDTKCTDEGASDSSCRLVKTAKRCL